MKKSSPFKKKDKCKIIYPEDVIVSKDLNGSPQKKELNVKYYLMK